MLRIGVVDGSDNSKIMALYYVGTERAADTRQSCPKRTVIVY